MATIPKVISYEEWLTMPEVQDGIEEVVNGEIRRMPPNKWPHAHLVHRLARCFERNVDDSVLVIQANFGLVISREPLTCRTPDLAVFRKNTIVEKDGYIHSAPQFIAEVASESESR